MVCLQHLRCEGLYSFYKPINFKFTNNMVIVGPNNSGKSNIFRLLKLLTDTLHRSSLDDSKISIGHLNPSLEISLKLSTDETQKIIDCFGFYTDTVTDRVKYHHFENREILLELFDEMTINLSWEKVVKGYESDSFIKINFPKSGLKFFNNSFSSFKISNKFPAKNIETTMEKKIKFFNILDGITEIKNTVEHIDHIFDDKIQTSIFLSNIEAGKHEQYDDVGKKTLTELLSYLELYPGYSNSISFLEILGQILQKGIIHSSGNRSNPSLTLLDYAHFLKIPYTQQVNVDGETRNDFNKVLDQRALDKVIEFDDMLKSDGSNLTQFLFSLKNSPKQNARIKFSKIKNEFHDIFETNNLDFDVLLQSRHRPDYDLVGNLNPPKPKIPAIMIVDKKLERQFPTNQVGSGILEVIYLLTLAHGVSNSVILLDEPSVNLHPNLMKSLTRSLQNSDNTNQFIVITHSPELTSHEIFEEKSDILYLRKTDQHTVVKKLDGETETWFNENRHRLRHQLDTQIFFSKGVIFTEGDSDKNLLIGISNFLESRSKGADITGNDIIITQVGGKDGFAKYEKLMASFEIPYLIIADYDAKDLFDSSGTISKDDVCPDGPVLVIEGGDLEDLMERIDSDAYSEAKRENKSSKPAIAYSFAEKIVSAEKLQIFEKIFKECIRLANPQPS